MKRVGQKGEEGNVFVKTHHRLVCPVQRLMFHPKDRPLQAFRHFPPSLVSRCCRLRHGHEDNKQNSSFSQTLPLSCHKQRDCVLLVLKDRS